MNFWWIYFVGFIVTFFLWYWLDSKSNLFSRFFGISRDDQVMFLLVLIGLFWPLTFLAFFGALKDADMEIHFEFPLVPFIKPFIIKIADGKIEIEKNHHKKQ